MDVLNLFEVVRKETGCDDRTAALLVLAQSIANKRLDTEDGEAIAHGVYCGLDRILEEGKPVETLVSGGVEV